MWLNQNMMRLSNIPIIMMIFKIESTPIKSLILRQMEGN